MDIREVENFLLWYIPAVIATHFISVALFFSDKGGVSFGVKPDFLLMSIGYLICGIWLFVNAPKRHMNKWLWAIFGLGAQLFAIVLYFLVVAFRTHDTAGETADEA